MCAKVQFKRGKKRGSSQSLVKWAVEEMGLAQKDLPSEEELNVLLRGTTGNSWEYIREHIHSQAKVETCKQNISLHSGVTTTEHAQILAERNELLRELGSLQVAVSQTLSDSDRLEADIVSMETANQRSRAELQELSNKSMILSAHSQKCQEMVNVAREFSRRILGREELFRHPEKEQSYFTRGGSHPSDPLQLESACMREVRCVCEDMVSAGDTIGKDEPRVRKQVWSKLESLLSSHPPHEILQSLTTLAVEQADQIHSHTTGIDLTRDACELRYQSGGGESSLVQSIEDHMTTARLGHVTRALAAEEVGAAAGRAQGELGEVKGHVEKCLDGYDDETVKELIKANFWLSVDVCGMEEALSVLSQYVSHLQSTQSEKRRRLDVLSKKKARVGQFAETADRNRAEIQELVRQSSCLKGRLQRQSTEVGVYLCDSVCGVEGVLVGETQSLVDSITTEIQLFSTVSLARAVMAPGLDSQSCSLSIHCLHPHQPSGSTHWSDLISLLNLPPCTPPERILCGIVECTKQGRRLTSDMKRRDLLLSVMKALMTGNALCEDVLQRSQSYDQYLRTKGLREVRGCVSVTSHGLSRCSHVQQTMKEWCDQPAQNTVPWVTCDGMSCDKWVEQWRVLTAKLGQLLASQKH